MHNCQELITKLQQQKEIVNRSNRTDEMNLHQKEVLEKKIRFIKETYEKQMKIIVNENEKFKQNFHQIERIITQLKRENEELQQKVKI